MRRPLALLTAAITVGGLALAPAAAPATVEAHGRSNSQEHKKIHKKSCHPKAAVKPSELVPQPTVTGPIGDEGIRTGEPYATTMAPLPDGWVEEEFFFSGTARDYQGSDEGPREYTQRILVRRPTDRAEFNGTIVLNWNNVTTPHDGGAHGWESLYQTAGARGFAVVSVSAQYLGTEVSPLALKQYDPERYGSLYHPGSPPGAAREGDDYSYDIFSQAAEASITPEVMGDLLPCVQRRLATGLSGSGDRLLKYIKGVHRQALVFDGFQPQHCTFSVTCGDDPADVPTDLVPILWVNSQQEIEAGPADGDLFRLWEVAGQAHTSYSQNSYWNAVLTYSHSNGQAGAWDPEDAGAWGYQAAAGDCLVDTYFPESYAWGAALVALDDWVRTGIAPEPQPRLARGEGPTGDVALVFDRHGNAVGGVRNPIVDVPIATYYVFPITTQPSQPCQVGENVPLRGSTQVFSAGTLEELYPHPTAEDYLEQFDAAVEDALAAGTLLPEGAEDLRRRALDAAAFIADATS